MASINREGVVSLGVSIKTFVDAIKRVNTINGTLFQIKMGIISDHRPESDIISCDPIQSLLRDDEIKIGRERYCIYCQPLDIAGIKWVRINHFFRENGLLTEVRRSDSVSSLLLAHAIISVFLSTAFFIMVISRVFILQVLTVNHDIRGALATVVGLVEVSPDSNLDLLELLNSVLDASRIEAGKMQLHEEVCDLSKVIEEAVNFVYPMGLEKGIDIVIHHCDSSVLKSSLVKGDLGKLKQVLKNLLSNTVKFTSELHVILLFINKKKDYNETLHMFKCNKKSLELVVEVNDTGKEIPKEKRDSIFKNFVQVKETTLGQGVRLMGGEISILEKEISKKGTCFNFNIFLFQDPCKIEGLLSSHVILVIQDDERRKVTKNFMRTLGVSTINLWEHKNIFWKKNILEKNIVTLPFFMIIIDDHVEPISEVCSVVANFCINLPGDMQFQIIGVLSPIINNKNMRIAMMRLMVTCGDIFIKLFHGSRLDQVLKLLP
ncbi:hypothetical protein MKX03_006799 [Papaver bracteatum]|nr:hypothetical protein MKX03_006799 [Papaver bracteatum]